MNIRQTAVLVMLVCVTSVAIPGNVYKCKSDDGSITFSGIPCSSDAEKVRIQRQNPSPVSGSGLRPGEIEAVNKIHEKELQERTRRTAEPPAKKSLSYSDRQRLDELQKEKSRILHDDGRRKLTASQRSGLLNSIDQEIAAIRGAPVTIQNNTESSRESTTSQPQQLIDPYSGNVMPRTGAGYTDPRTATFYHDTGSGVVNTKTGEFIPTH